jgi:dUTP pyrophosphatase
MKIKIKRFDKALPLPSKQTVGAAAFDLTAREEVIIAPGKVGYVPANIALETPLGYFLLVAARSSTHKKGLMLGNGIGIIDSDFSGDNDEIKVVCHNFTDQPVVVEKGFRIAQGIFLPVPAFEWDEVDELSNKDRGGFGSTGNK